MLRSHSEERTVSSISSAGKTGYPHGEEGHRPTHAKVHSKWVTVVHVRHNTVNIRKNIGEMLHDIELGSCLSLFFFSNKTILGGNKTKNSPMGLPLSEKLQRK